MRRARIVVVALGLAAGSMGVLQPATAAQLPSNCERVKGEVECVTFEGPGNNQAGVGETTSTETQGNATNTSPEPQDLDTTETCNPPSSKGKPCNP